MNRFHYYLFCVAVLLISRLGLAQNCGIHDPSFERHHSCPTSHSQFSTKSIDWFNVLNNTISTPDYFFQGQGCNFDSFTAAGGIRVSWCSTCFEDLSCYNAWYPGCGRGGLFLNYNDGSQDPKYKEYIGNRVDLITGRNYTLSLGLQRSHHSSSDSLERDLGIFGYNGAIPAAHVDFCPSGAVLLSTISRTLFNDDTFRQLSTTFTPSVDYDYLLLGPVCDGSMANDIGFLFIDRAILTDLGGNTLTPYARYANQESRGCCFSSTKDIFKLIGNKPPTGTTITWGQKTSNPAALTFLTPADTQTRISGTGPMVPGLYEFYYTWLKGGCTMTDTLAVQVEAGILADAGPDAVVCNNAAFTSNALSPTFTELFFGNYLSWWSMVDKSKPGGVFTFPPYVPYSLIDQFCENGPGAVNPLVIAGGTHSPMASFGTKAQSDTIDFIWNIIDECGTRSQDTMRAYLYQLQITGDSLQICPGDTTGYIYEILDSLYNLQHRNKLLWQYTWHVDDTAIDIVGGIHSDSIQITGWKPGTYGVFLDVYDPTNPLCDSLKTGLTIIIRDTASILHPNDTVLCGFVNLDITQALPAPGCEWWWDVMDTTQADGLFTLYNSDFPLHPFDGTQNDNVVAPGIISSTDSLAIFRFGYLRSQDSFTIIYNIIDDCKGDTLRDTVNVRVNSLRITGGAEGALCAGDTLKLLYQALTPFLPNPEGDTSLHYYWVQSAGTDVVDFLTDTLNDSVLIAAPNTPGSYYTVTLHLLDSDDDECPEITAQHTFYVSGPPAVGALSAGADIFICNTQLTPLTVAMNAMPAIADINLNGWQTWWSLIDTAEADSEFTFSNGCVPYDGFSNGNIACGSMLSCGFTIGYSSTAPNVAFSINDWGCYDFIWHMRYACDDSILFYEDDTVNVCWDYLETIVFAGGDDTADCSAYQLNGSTSSSSAANRGCFSWAQLFTLGGPAEPVTILDENNNVAYLSDLASHVPGWYYFEYTLGCGPCAITDTVSVYVPGSFVPSSAALSSSLGGRTTICEGDTIIFTGSGADQYQFFLNGTSLGDMGPVDTAVVFAWPQDTNVITMVVFNTATGCYSNIDSAITIVVRHMDEVLLGTADSFVYCAGSEAYLIALSTYPDDRVFWYSSADGFSAPVNMPFGTAPGDSLLVNPDSTTTYMAIIIDTASGCVSTDSAFVVVSPLNLPQPDPHLPADTAFCVSDDTISIHLNVSNSIAPGAWSVYSSDYYFINSPSAISTTLEITSGNYLVSWVENNFGCKGADSMQVSAVAQPQIDAGSDTAICKGLNVVLNASGYAETYKWTPATGLSNDAILNPQASHVDNAVLYILTASNGNGLCVDVDSVQIDVTTCPDRLNVPNAFSPNGDGVNDHFTIYMYGLSEFEIRIFNRWGEMVYNSTDLNELNDLNKGWDGTHRGKMQDAGTYVYYISGRYASDNQVVEQKGNITLIQ